jgi:RNA polymerase sigma-70 factor, ECF subfamily
MGCGVNNPVDDADCYQSGAESALDRIKREYNLDQGAFTAETTDEALMLAYQAGDAAAFDRLYANHRVALFRFLLRGCNNRAQAEEMFQDVWMSVIRARVNYRVSARFATWLYRIAHNRLVDEYRRQRPQDELDDEHPDDARGPEQLALQGEQARRLQQGLAALPLEQRSAILLQEERGLTLEEIAEVSGVGRETVKSRLRYALQKLREGLADA